MNTKKILDHLNAGMPIIADSEMHKQILEISQEALKITSKLNNSYHSQEEISAIMSELTGDEVNASLSLFPPFYTDFGKNMKIGKHVFVHSGCHFQDHGGIVIGDGTMIECNVVLTTLNHDVVPRYRSDLIPRPIIIGSNVWIGAGATIVPGITVGDHAVVAAGAVVTRDVPANTVVAGVPAKVIET